jgi:hypothetical protein
VWHADRGGPVGREAFAHDRVNGYHALFRREHGDAHFGIRADWLEWLSETPQEYSTRYGNVRVMGSEKPSGPVGIVADTEARHGGMYGPDPDRKWIPETWESAGPVLLAVVMPIKVNG